MPEISVIIPSYNHAAYIASAVQSVLDQTWADLELIVVDDGSKDDSLAVLSRFTDRRFRLIAQENQGAHAAINRGLHASTGKYLAILNSDDRYHATRLEKCLQAFKENPQAGFVGTYLEIIDSTGKPSGIKHGFTDSPPWLLEKPERSFRAGNDLHAALLTENYWSTTSNFVFRREAYENVGDFRPLRYTHDWDFALRLAQHFPMVLLPEALVSYRIHPANTIRENQSAMIFEICWILAVHLPQAVGAGLRPAPGLRPALPVDFVSPLLYSIYTYNCDRVLNVMLLQNLHENQALALALLDPANSQRKQYLEYIQEHSVVPLSSTAGSLSPPLSLYRRVRRKLSPLKAWILRKFSFMRRK